MSELTDGGVYLGFGDVVRFTEDPVGEGPVRWGEGLYVISDVSETDYTHCIGAALVGLEQDAAGDLVPKLDFNRGTEIPKAVQVFGTLAVGEVRTLLARGWEGNKPELALSILAPEDMVREARRFDFPADLSQAEDPALYRAPAEQ